MKSNRDDSLRVRISSLLKQKLDDIAAQLDLKRSDVARKALNEYVADWEEAMGQCKKKPERPKRNA